MKNKAMIIGSVGAGKSTLTNALLGKEVPAVKTQALYYYDWIVDTPGEYTENPMFYKSIMATSWEVTHVMYLQDATDSRMTFPPLFSLGIPKHPIGVITKSDHPDANIEKALAILRQTIPRGPVIISSSKKKTGLNHIKALVNINTMEEMKSYSAKQADHLILFV